MPQANANAKWNGDLKSGNGSMSLGSGAYTGPFSFKSRMESGATGGQTNPEELLAAAHAGCFSMALSAILGGAGHKPTSITTTAKVDFGPVPGGFAITAIHLSTEGVVPGIDKATFDKFANDAKAGCPVSKALASVPTITLETKFSA